MTKLVSFSRRAVVCWGTVAVALAVASTASAIPPLQLYIEGATYDSATETWFYQPLSAGDPIRLWTVANIDGPGSKGPIADVRLAISYAAGATPTFTLTPGKTDGYGGWVDRTIPDAPPLLRTVTDGSAPTMSDGRNLSSHDEFGDDVWWQEYDVGFYDETSSSIGDIIDDFPYDPDMLGGQINVYEITIENAEGLELHFDLYDSVVAMQRAVFAPFSHDAGSTIVPVPGAALLAIAGLGLVGMMRRKFS